MLFVKIIMRWAFLLVFLFLMKSPAMAYGCRHKGDILKLLTTFLQNKTDSNWVKALNEFKQKKARVQKKVWTFNDANFELRFSIHNPMGDISTLTNGSDIFQRVRILAQTLALEEGIRAHPELYHYSSYIQNRQNIAQVIDDLCDKHLTTLPDLDRMIIMTVSHKARNGIWILIDPADPSTVLAVKFKRLT